MANQYTVVINSIASDGTNYYVTATISLGATSFPPITPVFPVGTSAATITAYLQAVANNQPTLAADVANLVNSKIQGA